MQGSEPIQDKLTKFLFKYRITPHTTTGIPPSELLMNCRQTVKQGLHQMQGSINLLRRWKNGVSLGATCSGQPYKTNWSDLESTGSRYVQSLTCFADTGVVSKCSIIRIVLPGIGISWKLTGSGSLLHPSALAYCEPCLYWI